MPRRSQGAAGEAVRLAKPEKVPQPHGGALYAGGVPGHRGGNGRTPNDLKELLRANLGELAPMLHARMMGRKKGELPPSDETLIRYFGELQKKALPSEKEIGFVSVDDVRERMQKTVEILVEMLGREAAQPILDRLRDVWSKRPKD